MNILLLSWRAFGHPNAGGAEKVTLEHAKVWVRAGHKVTIFTSFFNGAENEVVESGVKIIRRGGQYLDVQVRAFIYYFLGKHKHFDLVIDEFHGIPFFTPLYVRVKKLAFIHEVTKEVWSLYPWPKLFLIPTAFVGRKVEPWIFRLFYKNIPFMTVSNSTKDELLRWGIKGDNINVIENGVDRPPIKKLPRKETSKTAIFLGAISKDKGIFDAIKAFSELKKNDKGWKFWIVGKGAEGYIKDVKNLVRKLGIHDKTKFYGFVSDKKRFEFLARAHVLINPSVREGWGLVNIEANSVGTPVVGYNVSGMRDSIKDGKTGILVKKGNYNMMAKVTQYLIDNRKIYTVMRKECIKWSKNYSWKKSTTKSLSLIENL